MVGCAVALAAGKPFQLFKQICLALPRQGWYGARTIAPRSIPMTGGAVFQVENVRVLDVRFRGLS